jgi:hypothetical protein
MTRAFARAGSLILCLSLLQACGGGGGDDGDGGPDSGARVRVSSTNVSVSATPGDDLPIETLTVTVSNAPTSGVFFTSTFSESGVQGVNVVTTSETQSQLHIVFKSASSLLNDTYEDEIVLRACKDAACAKEFAGSPLTITTSYVVSGSGTSTATLDRQVVEPIIYRDEGNRLLETVTLRLAPRPLSEFIVFTEGGTNGIESVRQRTIDDVTTALDLTYFPGGQLNGGIYRDTVTVTVCYDNSCVRQVEGSPFSIRSKLTVDPVSERGLAHLAVASRTALAHDIVDAEFSKALNSIVMVGAYPSNSLHIYDVETGIERHQALNRAPTSVSISPDGLTAAVGHDALVTVIDLATVGQAGAPAPIHLNVSSDIFDVVLDGNGFVHAFPETDQWVQLHSVEIATNIESLGSGSLRAGSHARLNPGTDWIYSADNGLSPSDIEKWDVAAGAGSLLYDSPYHGDYGMCGNLWFNESGTTIYTACGNTFRASADQAQDMTYSGALTLAAGDFFSVFMIEQLSHSDLIGEIALIELNPRDCGFFPSDDPCYTHLALYEDEFLNRQAVYSIRPLLIDGIDYLQRGLFVFHDATTGRKHLLSRLKDMPDLDAEYYVSVVE